MKRLSPISDEQVVALLPALAEAARADQGTAQRFVAPRIGILEETASRRHQFVFGRRGVGKSTLVRKVQSLGDIDPQKGPGDVVFIDIETLRARPYPDVLIELLVDLLDSLESRLQKKAGRVDLDPARRRARRGLRRLRGTMQLLLDEPQTAHRTIKEAQSRTRSAAAGGKLNLRLRSAQGTLDASSAANSMREEAREALVEETKMDGLLGAAVLIRRALQDAQAHLDQGPVLIVLDDFYHVQYDDQPDVLAYLHQIVKNLDIYLKVVGVRHRIQPFVEDDPPRGLQPGHDAGEVSLDITLERFSTAQQFLERILAGICEPLGVELTELISEGGRQRLVLGSGGVARDYLTLTHRAVRIATEREANPSRLHNRIGAEDVNEAAALMSAQKQEDLRLDASGDAERLRQRLADIVKFCLDVNKTNVLLVEGPALQEKDWGKEIQALADLRLLHEFGNLSEKRGEYRGRRFVGFTLDLSNYTGTRSEQITAVEFWTSEGRQAARSPTLVYTPGASERTPAKRPDRKQEPLPRVVETVSQPSLEGLEWVQTDIYEYLTPVEQPDEAVEDLTAPDEQG